MKKIMVLLIAMLFVLAGLMFGQQTTVTLPAASQKAKVSQRIGLTDITIAYASPGVKKREVWGKLVPYDKLWRAGADENTTITFSHDVTVEGQALKKGTYGLFMTPGKDSWEIVFSKNHTSWGHYFYKKEEDALRVKVKAEAAPHREWLTYDFMHREADSVVASLHWEKLRVPFKIGVDVKKIVVENMRNELRSLPWWDWKGTRGAAKYCYDNDVNLEEALKWIEQSITRKENFQNTILKSKILDKLGKTADAAKTKTHALKIATEFDMTQYAYSFAVKDKAKSESMLLSNIKKFKTWSSYRALARFYNYFKDKAKAATFFQKALKKAPADKKEEVKKELEKAK